MATTIAGFSDPNTISELTWANFWSKTPMREQVIGFTVSRVPATLDLSVAGGSAWLSGVYYETDSVAPLSLSPNASGSDRYDLVVLEADWTTKSVTASVVEGSPGGGAPAATRIPGTVWQVEVAVVRVPSGVTEILPSGITMVGLPVAALYSVPTIEGLSDERFPPVEWRAAVHAEDTGLLYVSDGTAYRAVTPTAHTHPEYQTKITYGLSEPPASGNDGDVYFRYS